MKKPAWPIVMMFPLPEGAPSKGKHKQLLDKNQHPALYNELSKKKGIYIFYDSGGRCVYVGQTKKTLWFQGRVSLNNRKSSVVMIDPKDPQQVKKASVPLHKIAAYFSAYEVESEDLIDFFESLLVTAFPNDLHNVQMPQGLWADKE